MADEAQQAQSLALKLLARQSRTHSEIQAHLDKKGFAPEIVRDTLARLAELRYIDDRRFALDWGRARLEKKKIGKHRLEQELLAKGVAQDLARETVDHIFEAVDEYASAKTLARQKLASFKNADTENQKRRLAGFLERQGFSQDTVEKVLDALIPE
jgi:regulatory protein